MESFLGLLKRFTSTGSVLYNVHCNVDAAWEVIWSKDNDGIEKIPGPIGCKDGKRMAPHTHHIPAPAPVNTTFIQPTQGGPPRSFHAFYFSYLLRSFIISFVSLTFCFLFTLCSNILILICFFSTFSFSPNIPEII
jgi:hypothetical protein